MALWYTKGYEGAVSMEKLSLPHPEPKAFGAKIVGTLWSDFSTADTLRALAAWYAGWFKAKRDLKR